MNNSVPRSKYANPEAARTGFYVLAPLAAIVAVLTVSTSPILAAAFVGFTVVLVLAARDSDEAAVTGRWNWLDVLAVLALVGLVYVYGGIASVLGNSPAAYSAENIFVYACWFAAIAFVVSVRRGAGLRDLGWRLPSTKWLLAVPVAVVAGNIFSSLILTAEFHTSVFHGAAQTQCTDTQSAFGTNLGGFILGLPVVSLAAPVVEETLFRGFFYGWLARMIPSGSANRTVLIGAAMVVSGLVFGIFHATYGALYILPLMSVGIILSGLYQWSGSIVPGMLTHAIFNAWGLVEILLTKSQC